MTFNCKTEIVIIMPYDKYTIPFVASLSPFSAILDASIAKPNEKYPK
ncbi:MAG: hypothetical protein Hyperionvirus16_9 [Hyperionvirus sp.]|uniref:Uncharacterized protein n=1 Tax=Hyperionvirus sp. TaxID=2487770 RepID=A0A3G5ABS5_9VIRU|nr:MAG: hypothetical protein Hyperionvirus16_9 [Hyperionvirus sp.]